MGEMDLIPGDYRQNLIRKHRTRHFVVACVLLLVGIGLARGLLTYLIWRENVQVVRLEQQDNILQQQEARTASYRQQKQVTEQQLAALDELRGRDRVANFLKAIDHAYSDGIWFDSVHFMRQSKSGALDNLPGATNANITVVPEDTRQDSDLTVDILGHAINHSLLAEFMRELGAQPGIADLRLIDTGLRSYTTTQVVDFNLALQMGKQPVQSKLQEAR